MDVNILATVLSAIYPGVGQIKNTEVTKGIFLILFFTMLLLMAFYPGSQLQLIGFVLLPVIWVWSVVDASQIFMFRPGGMSDPGKMQKLLIGVVVAWLVLEAVFVPTMWSLTRHGDDRDGSMVGADHASQPIQIPSETGSPLDGPPVTNDGTENSTVPTDTAQADVQPVTQEADSGVTEAAVPEQPQTSTTEQPEPPEPQPVKQPELAEFAISLGAFIGPIQANRQREAVARAGFDAILLHIRSRSGTPLYNVVVPGFASQEDASVVLRQLKTKRAFRDCSIIRTSKLNIIE